MQSSQVSQLPSMQPFAELLTTLKGHDPNADGVALDKACEYAKTMHDGQTRASGEPYYTHPIEVASILADMKMDPGTIITAILHDTLEDTKATYEDLKKKFGKEVADLVNGVSKLTRIESQTIEGKQAENFRKLLLAMSEDIRVLLVKLADRLHNMRTIDAIQSPEKRRRIALETLEIYAPLAERVGVHSIKEELEDLAFGVISPEARKSISNRLSFLREEGNDVVRNIIDELQKLLDESGIDADISGREKTKYSIWKKMQRKNVAFEQLSDIMAFPSFWSRRSKIVTSCSASFTENTRAFPAASRITSRRPSPTATARSTPPSWARSATASKSRFVPPR
jgi:guanosine-3',5'-bis(diphosphate) 3'-pyrophosphohydrolase